MAERLKCETDRCPKYRVRGRRYCLACSEHALRRLEDSGTLTPVVVERKRDFGSGERRNETRSGG